MAVEDRSWSSRDDMFALLSFDNKASSEVRGSVIRCMDMLSSPSASNMKSIMIHSSMCGSDRKTVMMSFYSLASLILRFDQFFYDALLDELIAQSRQEYPKFQVIQCGIRRMYDETPLPMRVLHSDGESRSVVKILGHSCLKHMRHEMPQHVRADCESIGTAKIVYIEFAYWFLLKLRGDESAAGSGPSLQYIMLQGKVVKPLRAIDHSSSECLYANIGNTQCGMHPRLQELPG